MVLFDKLHYNAFFFLAILFGSYMYLYWCTNLITKKVDRYIQNNFWLFGIVLGVVTFWYEMKDRGVRQEAAPAQFNLPDARTPVNLKTTDSPLGDMDTHRAHALHFPLRLKRVA